MHLLASQPGGFTDDEGIVDLGQSPADIIILSAADSALAALADSAESLPADFPSLRLANWMHLLKPAAFDLYRNKVIDHAQVVVLSLLGGENYWQYGFEQLQEWAAADKQRHLIIVPGDDTPDETLFAVSTVDTESAIRVWRFLREGGALNNQQLYYFLADQSLKKEGLNKESLSKESLSKESLSKESLEKKYNWHEPQALPRCLLYLPALPSPSSKVPPNPLFKSKNNNNQASFIDCQRRWHQHNPEAPMCVLLFYRSHLQSANTAMFDELIFKIEQQGLNVLPIAIASLKDKQSLALVNALLLETKTLEKNVKKTNALEVDKDKNSKINSETKKICLIINTTSFASNTVSSPELSSEPTGFQSPFVIDVPVLQLILSSSTEDDWNNYSQGLRSRDIAMQVVLPEMDGRIITRAISFKAEEWFSERCEIAVVRYALHQERASFVAQLARQYCQLAVKNNAEKRIALILANYPTKDGRIGNGVGLDTLASTINILHALQEQKYPVNNIPENGNALVTELLGAVTNNPNTLHQLSCWQSLEVEEYKLYFSQLPEENQRAVIERWGEPESDPKYRKNEGARTGGLMLSGLRLGEVFVGIQPARGFNIDLAANYHDPDLVPPHSYLAFYFWLRHCYQVDAIIHVGKHGNLEWLPGKGTALSAHCWPDIALGPLPHFYPFIVNDPGEGAQAKRRAQAVIIDHLMPPITRAETYGELAELEGLVDEYYQAMGLDARRERWLKDKILDLAKKTNVLEELPKNSTAKNVLLENSSVQKKTNGEILNDLDTYLCDIKEAQIRHGLHILGELPAAEKLTDTVLALLRLPRGEGVNEQGILHNLVNDLGLYHVVKGQKTESLFDPLQSAVEPWQGNRPECLLDVSTLLWRTTADTRERLEILAATLISAVINAAVDSAVDQNIETPLPKTYQQLQYVKKTIMTALNDSAEQEISALMKGLSGYFIEPGPSGAPTRGRLDTLPTGRNFFSVDNRSIPSPAACAIGEKSANSLIERHLQEHGDYPKHLGLSVWGTATMRTGGDDIAQAFTLMGIKPIRAAGSQRVIDFEIIPCMLLGRPRVDVTLRVSGFFRDAFPNVMKLYDAAVLALAEFDDPGTDNTIQRNIRDRTQVLMSDGATQAEASRQASYRVFGSKPGAYGAGLQGLIDERCWETRGDLAEAYVNWGGYAYGISADGEGADDSNNGHSNGHQDGVEAKDAFQHQLSRLDVVVHNQDNREHDLLDSDDYYQFQGGMVNAVTEFSNHEPVTYHNDHSNPAMPKVRTLKEELNRVIRSRVLNPKWIHAMQEHGYKGAFEMAASVDYLFAYDATTNLIDDYQYQKVADALVFDEKNKAFMEKNNPNALEEMAERLLEATQRGMWSDDQGYAERLQTLLLEMDESQEGSL
jgi:cobaltochelatase CobN